MPYFWARQASVTIKNTFFKCQICVKLSQSTLNSPITLRLIFSFFQSKQDTVLNYSCLVIIPARCLFIPFRRILGPFAFKTGCEWNANLKRELETRIWVESNISHKPDANEINCAAKIISLLITMAIIVYQSITTLEESWAFGKRRAHKLKPQEKAKSGWAKNTILKKKKKIWSVQNSLLPQTASTSFTLTTLNQEHCPGENKVLESVLENKKSGTQTPQFSSHCHLKVKVTPQTGISDGKSSSKGRGGGITGRSTQVDTRRCTFWPLLEQAG